ncbi:MAG: hypothetical protein E3J72_10060 [Planctomycetota bacterium]|nr:MAG: hypothetical protein E3J72_10060 [Planctomycetota bacterium]
MQKSVNLSIIALVLCGAGCATVAYDRGVEINDDELARRLNAKLEKLFPQSMRAVHRVYLKALGREIVLEGYVLAKRPGKVRLLAKGDIGGTVFDAARAGGKERVLANSLGLRESWIKKGALRDAGIIHLCGDFRGTHIVRHSDGSIGLMSEQKKGRRKEYVFSPDSRLIGYIESFGDSKRYEIIVSYPEDPEESAAEAQPGGRPKIWKIRDYKLKYEAKINIISVTEANIRDELFEKKPDAKRD